MAAKRLARSMVDWTAFAERVPPAQKDAFRVFKAKSEAFVARVHKYPENMPAINWDFYKSRVPVAGMVDKFQKDYAGLSIPYPTDKDNVVADIDKEKVAADETSKKFVSELNQNIADSKALLQAIDSLPPLEEMTHEMYADYFPDQARNPWDKPTLWPHTKDLQSDSHPDNVK